jgi:hypothetical protein
MVPETFRPEPRCHVCRTDSIREQVNAMLATGSSYAQIVRAVGADGAGELSLDSVRNHANRHFPVQNAAQATYREIVERRAAENQIDFVAGVGTALTPVAYLETIMAKAFEGLVKDGTDVSVETGLRAAEKLQAFAGDRDRDREILQMHVVLGRITAAVKSVVPQHMWAEISDKLDDQPVDPGDDGDDDGPIDPDGPDDDDDDQPVDPGDDGDDDEF